MLYWEPSRLLKNSWPEIFSGCPVGKQASQSVVSISIWENAIQDGRRVLDLGGEVEGASFPSKKTILHKQQSISRWDYIWTSSITNSTEKLQLWLRSYQWKILFHHSSGPYVLPKYIYKRGRQRSHTQKRDLKSRSWNDRVASQGMLAGTGSWKRQEMAYPPEPSESMQAC